MYSRARQETLLREYAEAGEICRQNERLTRTGFYLFVLVATAIIGFAHQEVADDTLAKILNFAGLLISVVTLNVTRRLQLYYRSYIRTAKGIEEALGMHLYRRGKVDVDSSCTITQSNKYAYNTFIAAAVLYFLYEIASAFAATKSNYFVDIAVWPKLVISFGLVVNVAAAILLLLVKPERLAIPGGLTTYDWELNHLPDDLKKSVQRNKKMFRWGIALLLVGFVVQVIGVWIG